MTETKYGVWYDNSNMWCNGTNGRRFESADINEAFRLLERYWSDSDKHYVKEMFNE